MADMDVDKVIEELEAIPQTRERKMMLAIAYEVRALKGGRSSGRGKTGGQPKAGDKGSDSEG